MPKINELATIAAAGAKLVASDSSGDAGNVLASDFATASQGSLADTAVQPGDLATVATSGAYSDLSGTPTLGTAAAADTGDFATAAQGGLAATAVQPNDLAAVATSGAYSDLSGTPTLGTAAFQNIGTSGANVPLLNTVNTWGSNQYIMGSLAVGTAVPVRQFHTRGSNSIWRLDRDTDTAGMQIHRFPDADFTMPWKGFMIGVTASGENVGEFSISDYGRAVSGGVTTRLTIGSTGVVAPGNDNAQALGSSSQRWSVVYAATGTINTSDARDKDVTARIGDWSANVVDAVEPTLYRWLVGGNDVEHVIDGYDEEEQPVFEDVVETVDEIAVEDGRAVTRTVERTVKRQVFDELPLVGEDGEPIMTDGVQAIHRVPRTVSVRVPRGCSKVTEKPGTRLHAGWLAQEVKAALDDVGIDCGAWGLEDVADANSKQWVRPDQMTAILWAALRETRRELAALKAAMETMTS